MKLPTVSEGWSWNITRPTIPCTNPKCCSDDSAGHQKVRIELLLHDTVRRHGLIDVEFYGDNQAVIQRAQAMLNSVVREQTQTVAISCDELRCGQLGERWRDNQGDVWEWHTNRWVCDRGSEHWTLYSSDDSRELGPFELVP